MSPRQRRDEQRCEQPTVIDLIDDNDTSFSINTTRIVSPWLSHAQAQSELSMPITSTISSTEFNTVSETVFRYRLNQLLCQCAAISNQRMISCMRVVNASFGFHTNRWIRLTILTIVFRVRIDSTRGRCEHFHFAEEMMKITADTSAFFSQQDSRSMMLLTTNMKSRRLQYYHTELEQLMSYQLAWPVPIAAVERVVCGCDGRRV
jgi:hypothetical protein